MRVSGDVVEDKRRRNIQLHGDGSVSGGASGDFTSRRAPLIEGAAGRADPAPTIAKGDCRRIGCCRRLNKQSVRLSVGRVTARHIEENLPYRVGWWGRGKRLHFHLEGDRFLTAIAGERFADTAPLYGQFSHCPI